MNKRMNQKIAAGVDVNEDSDSDGEHSTDDSCRTEANTRAKDANDAATARQRRALRLVSSQAFLFVGSFMLCNTLTFVLRHIIPGNVNGGDPVQNYNEEMEIPYNHFALMVLQAMLFPLQGLLNMMIYIRPKVSN